MTAIVEREEGPSRSRALRPMAAVATALAALALAVPGWAAAQEAQPETPAPDEPDMTIDDPETMPEEPQTISPEEIETVPETMPEEEDLEPLPPEELDTSVTAEPGAETGAMEPAAAPTPERGDRPQIGAAVAAGGGVSEFSRSDARSFVNTGGAWELRGVFGTRSIVGVEAAYIGAAYEIEAPLNSTTLVSNGAEVSGRLNVLRNGMDGREMGLQPYALAGIAWKNYQVTGDLATADVQDEDNAFEIPVGAGVAYYFDNGILLDGRFAYRFAFEDELIQPVGEDDTPLDNWSATARLGLEF